MDESKPKDFISTEEERNERVQELFDQVQAEFGLEGLIQMQSLIQAIFDKAAEDSSRK